MDLDANYCDLCKLSFSTEPEFKEHGWSMLHHKKLDQIKGRNIIHKCDLCDENVFALLSFAKHIHSEKHQNNLLKWKYKKVESLNEVIHKKTTLPQQQNSFTIPSNEFSNNPDDTSTYTSLTTRRNCTKYISHMRTTRSSVLNAPKTRNCNESDKFNSPFKYVSEQYLEDKRNSYRKSNDRTNYNPSIDKGLIADINTKTSSTMASPSYCSSAKQNINSEMAIQSPSMENLPVLRIQGKIDSSTSSTEATSADALPEHLQCIIKRSKAAIAKIRKQRSQQKTESVFDTINSKLSKYKENTSSNFTSASSDFKRSSAHGSITKGWVSSLDTLPVDEVVVSRELSERTRSLLERTKPVTVPISDVQSLLKQNRKIIESLRTTSGKHKSQIGENFKEDRKRRSKVKASNQEFQVSLMKRKTRKRKNEHPQPATDCPSVVTTANVSKLESDSSITRKLSTDDDSASNSITDDEAVTEGRICEFKKSDGTFCVSRTQDRFCSYHKRVVQAVELYITNKVRTGTPSVSDAVSLIEMSDQESDCSVNVEIDEESAVQGQVVSIPMKRKRSLSDGNTSENHVVDFSRFKINKQKRHITSADVTLPNSSEGTDGLTSASKNVKLSRFKYLKSLSSGTHEISNIKKLPSNVRKFLDKKQQSNFHTESTYNRDSSLSQSESEADSSAAESYDAISTTNSIKTSRKNKLNETRKTANSMKLPFEHFKAATDQSNKVDNYLSLKGNEAVSNFIDDIPTPKEVTESVSELNTSCNSTPVNGGSLSPDSPIDSSILKTLLAIPASTFNAVTTEKDICTSYKEIKTLSSNLHGTNAIYKNGKSSPIYSLIHKYTGNGTKSNVIVTEAAGRFQNNKSSSNCSNITGVGVTCNVTSPQLTAISFMETSEAATRTIYTSDMTISSSVISQPNLFNEVSFNTTATNCDETPSYGFVITKSSTPKTVTTSTLTSFTEIDTIVRNTMTNKTPLQPHKLDTHLDEDGSRKDVFIESSFLEGEKASSFCGQGIKSKDNNRKADQSKEVNGFFPSALDLLVRKENFIRLKLVETKETVKDLQDKLSELEEARKKYHEELKSIDKMKKSLQSKNDKIEVTISSISNTEEHRIISIVPSPSKGYSTKSENGLMKSTTNESNEQDAFSINPEQEQVSDPSAQTFNLSETAPSDEPTKSLLEHSENPISESTFQSSKYATPPSSPQQLQRNSISYPRTQENRTHIAMIKDTEKTIADLTADVTCMKVDGNFMYIATRGPIHLIVYDIKKEKMVHKIEKLFRKRVSCIEVVCDGSINIVYIGTASGEILGFSCDANTKGKVFRRMGSKRRGITCITSTSRNGIDFVYSGTNHGKVYVRSVDGNLISEIGSLGKRTVIHDIKVIDYVLYTVCTLRSGNIRIYGFDCLSAHLVRKIYLPTSQTCSAHAYAFSDYCLISLENSTAIRRTDLMSGVSEVLMVFSDGADLPHFIKACGRRIFCATKNGIIKELFLENRVSATENLILRQ